MKKIVTYALAGSVVLSSGAFASNAHAAVDCFFDVIPTQVYQFKTGEVNIYGTGLWHPSGSVTVCNRNTDGALCDNWLSLFEAAVLSGHKVRVKGLNLNLAQCPSNGQAPSATMSVGWVALM